MFDEAQKLVLGLITGVLFGVLLQKGRAAKFRVIVGQFLFTDWTVVKIMLTAVAVGAVGVWMMVQMGWTSLHIKPAAFAPVIIGGVLFGMGMAIFGYCPGTSVAACGEGRRDAMVGVLGMLGGALAYVAAFPALQGLTKALGRLGESHASSDHRHFAVGICQRDRYRDSCGAHLFTSFPFTIHPSFQPLTPLPKHHGTYL